MTQPLYLQDSYAQRCDVTVMSVDGEKVVLDQTICYPTGGGQEHDTGLLRQGERAFEIYQVKKESGQIIHYVKHADELQPGPGSLELNWDRRWGLMRHHTLLHVLGAVVYEKFGGLCTGNQIYPERARIDFSQLGDLSPEQIAEIEAEANRIIAEDHPVTSRTISREEAENTPGMIKTLVSLLPPAVTEVRLIAIGTIDEQACGGTHLKRTGEIGSMVIRDVKSKGAQNKRLEVQALL